ncbi:MAG: pyridoxal-dependent decarboxylase, exosortase A system-associated [Halieaceae bacterium]|uniref:pyridoxal-dependent decarboxylase, exosortase A system-associated n=1 Tax=Haliea alexandrii TaxID=2448162 RepID=UPI000F0BC08F|nr:pyridoxal-dependent decarboxylase, exosortase A system-associated [Haliea alexandrii]MCR9186172.1 pyridoxal-dependent decarboxylase, exosortase A system-associated [Halieaceae bacterium]
MTEQHDTSATKPRERGRPQHAPQNHFAVRDNCLQVGNQAVTELARQANGRPFYAYDHRVMDARVAQLRQQLPDAIHLHYAIKANPMPALVQYMAGLTDGLDVASAAELATALATGINPAEISFAGPGKSLEDLRAAVHAGVIIILESMTEMQRVADIATELGTRPPVAIRVNPDFELKASGMKMGGGPKPFGIDAEEVPDAMARADALGLDLVGVHIFSGSQNLRPEALIEAHDKTFELALRLAGQAPRPFRWLNIGGGFGVPYFPGEEPLDLSPVVQNLQQRVDEALRQLPDVELVMELGRYLVAEAGIYVCTVSDKKISRGQTFLITNGGLHHHLAASGNFGQVIRKNYPVCIGNRVISEEQETVTIVGPLCTPLDLLGERMPLPTADIGDLVVLFQSGAYGYTASPHLFLSHPQPLEFFV